LFAALLELNMNLVVIVVTYIQSARILSILRLFMFSSDLKANA
jgi:hypothetical protein